MLNYGKKYKLGKKEFATRVDGVVIAVRRVIALRDIPLHGVKSGDVGGYIESKANLEQDGDAWVGGNAFVSGRSRIRHNALATDDAIIHSNASGLFQWVGGNAVVKDFAIVRGTTFVIQGNVIIQDNARLTDSNASNNVIVKDRAEVVKSSLNHNAVIKDDASIESLKVQHKAVISGNARLVNSLVIDAAVVTDYARCTNSGISGTSFVGGNARVEDSKIRDNTRILDRVKINEGTICEGNTQLSGDLVIPPGHYIFNKVMEGETTEYFGAIKQNKEIATTPELSHVDKTVASIETKITEFDLGKVVSDIEQEYKSYSADIVKLIKYPVMVDPSVSQTQEFLFTLRQAKRFTGDEDAQRELAEKLERSFMIAEANALKVSSSAYSDEERKRATDAKQFINKACDDTSSIVEKKNSFRATMKALEGVVALPEEAIDAYREKIGLLEIEA